MENQPENTNPLDKAKQLINTQKEQRLLKEELEKQEMNQRLDLLFTKYIDLLNESQVKKESVSRLTGETHQRNIEKNNLSSGQKQAWGVLKNAEDTSRLFEKDKQGDEDLHTERREVFGAVFQDSQDEKREVKKEIRELEKSLYTEGRERSAVQSQIEEMKKNPDWQSLIEKKKEEFLSAERDSGEFYRVDGNKISRLRETKNIQEFIKEHSEDIKTLEHKLRKGFEDLIESTQKVFENAQKSEEYKPKDFGEINFESYKSLLPTKTEDIKFSINTYDSNNLTLSQFDPDSPFYTTIMKDLQTIENEVAKKDREIQKATGFFSGRKSLEKQKANLRSKRNFFYKILQSVDEYQRQFHSITSSELQTKDRKDYRNSIGYAVGRFVQGIKSYELAKEQVGYPDFKKETTVNDLFQWKNIEEIFSDTILEDKEKAEEWDKIKSLEQEKRKEYDLVAGDGASQRLY